MRINLGRTQINYRDNSVNSFMIFSQILNTGMSYEYPCLVNNINQLHAWFGKNRGELSFLEYLLGRNSISLFLHKPIDPVHSWEKKWSIYSDNTGNPIIIFNTSTILEHPYIQFKVGNRYYAWNPSQHRYSPIVGESSYVKYLGNDGNEIVFDSVNDIEFSKLIYRIYDQSGKYEYNGIRYSNYIKVDDSYIRVEDLPKEESNKNRDCLTLYTNGYYTQSPNPFLGYEGVLNPDLLHDRYHSYAFNISSLEGKTGEKDEYFIIRGDDGENHLFYFTNDIPEESTDFPKPLSEYYTISHKIDLENLGSELEDIGYIYRSDQGILYSTFPTPVTYFYKISDFQFSPNYIESQNFIAGLLEDIEDKVVQFTSKTIGTTGYEEDNIRVKIELIDINTKEVYIEINRNDYKETFEGFWESSIEHERIDYIISRNSNLVRFQILNTTKPIPTGEWELRGAIKEEVTFEMYENALSEMMYKDSYADYLLIPNIDDWVDPEEQRPLGSPYSIYNTLLRYAKIENCQILIQNTEENTIYNYLGDIQNRLIYFYKDMLDSNRVKMPAYYAFIQALLDDVYAISSSDIYYESPTINLDLLKNRKSNYLTYNELSYFYDTYFNGENPESTGWMRFVIDKVKRELEKNKWLYLGTKMGPSNIRNIQELLTKIQNQFSIIRKIEITDSNLNFQANSLNLTINISLSDLVNNNITIDITLNYN